MKILITGGCGFIGSNLAIFLKEKIKNVKITSVDNLSRKGSHLNQKRLVFFMILTNSSSAISLSPSLSASSIIS